MATSRLFCSLGGPIQSHTETPGTLSVASDRQPAAAHDAPDATAQRYSQSLKEVVPRARRNAFRFCAQARAAGFKTPQGIRQSRMANTNMHFAAEVRT